MKPSAHFCPDRERIYEWMEKRWVSKRRQHRDEIRSKRTELHKSIRIWMNGVKEDSLIECRNSCGRFEFEFLWLMTLVHRRLPRLNRGEIFWVERKCLLAIRLMSRVSSMNSFSAISEIQILTEAAKQRRAKCMKTKMRIFSLGKVHVQISAALDNWKISAHLEENSSRELFYQLILGSDDCCRGAELCASRRPFHRIRTLSSTQLAFVSLGHLEISWVRSQSDKSSNSEPPHFLTIHRRKAEKLLTRTLLRSSALHIVSVFRQRIEISKASEIVSARMKANEWPSKSSEEKLSMKSPN